MSLHMLGVYFKIYEEMSPKISLEPCLFSQRGIEVGHILWSYKQPQIMLQHSFPISSAVHKVQKMVGGREPGSVTELLWAGMQIVYLFRCLDF